MPNLSPKLLIVDDLIDWQKTLAGCLQDRGYDVSVAGSARQALSILSQGEYHLAILDCRLDETDEEDVGGLWLARDIRERWPNMKILLVTGYGTLEILQRSMEPGIRGKSLVDDLLPKGEIDRLMETVLRILGK